MKATTSKEGTKISYNKLGSGHAIILAGGGFDDGSENIPLANILAYDAAGLGDGRPPAPRLEKSNSRHWSPRNQ